MVNLETGKSNCEESIKLASNLYERRNKVQENSKGYFGRKEQKSTKAHGAFSRCTCIKSKQRRKMCWPQECLAPNRLGYGCSCKRCNPYVRFRRVYTCSCRHGLSCPCHEGANCNVRNLQLFSSLSWVVKCLCSRNWQLDLGKLHMWNCTLLKQTRDDVNTEIQILSAVNGEIWTNI